MTWKDLSNETHAHIEEKALDLIESGVPEKEAWERAHREFGNVTLTVESSRDVWRWMWLEQLAQDIRYTGRTLRRSAAFTTVAVLTLALGIGAATAVYSIVDAVLLRPLPYKDPDRLVAIWGHGLRDSNLSKIFLNYSDFEEFRRKATTVDEVSAATWAGPLASHLLTGTGAARQLTAIPVSASFFDLLGAPAALGRTFLPDDKKAGCAVVLAHSLWVGAFGSDSAAAGRSITLDQKPCSVVGIMPERFTFFPSRTQAWILMRPGQAGQLGVGIFARLKQGVTREQAQAEMARLYAALDPGRAQRFEPVVFDLHGEFTFLASRTLRATLLVAFGAVGLLQLISCLNVGNLLLARLAERQREMAVRAALGSGQGRLARQVLTESLLLSVLGALGGVGLAAAVIRYFQLASPIELTVGADLRLNGRVLGFAIALAVATGSGFGFWPALVAAQANLVDRLKAGGRGIVAGRWAWVSIAMQMGMSFVLLIAAALLMQSSLSMGSERLGFEPAGRVSSSFTLAQSKYADPQQRITFYQRLEREIGILPGVQDVALASKVPPDAGGFQQQIEIQGQTIDLASRPINVGTDSVSPKFFSTLEVPLLKGRLFDSRDRQSSEPVAIVNQKLAEEYFPASDPIGQHIRLVNAAGPSSPWLTIVGVVGSLKQTELLNEMRWVVAPHLYRPVEQEPLTPMNVVLRLASGAFVAESFKRVTSTLDPEVPFADLQPTEAQISGLLAYPRFRARVLSFFALSALLLSAVGLHGVLTQLLGKRKAEFGVRRAVGATTRHILLLVLRQAGLPIAGGLCGGLILTFALSRLISSLLYGSAPPNPGVLAGAAFVLLATSALAILRPALRATRIDPVIALRQE